MTGAVMPGGLDTVVPKEFTREANGRVTIPAGIVRPGDNRRLAGEDLARGEAALRAGRILRPADLGLLASLGRAEVPVWRRLRVAFFSTGDELRSVGEPLDPGCVYDSNRYTLWGMLQRLGVEPIDMGVVPDDPQALEAAFRAAAVAADAVITSGGVSVGEADHTRQVMARVGDVLFWKIAMRPGRPMAIGRIGSAEHAAILFGLPGNPVAVMVTFYAFVRGALLAMSGAEVVPLPLLRAAATRSIRKKPGRTEYQRGIVSQAADGRWQVEITGSQGSGILRSMSVANGLVVLGHDQGTVEAGDLVDVLPFDGLICSKLPVSSGLQGRSGDPPLSARRAVQARQRAAAGQQSHIGVDAELGARVGDVEVAHRELADAVLRREGGRALLHRQPLRVVGQVGRARVEDRVVVAAAQLDRHLAGDRARHPALRRLAQHQRLRIEPAALVQQAAETAPVVAVLLDRVLVVDAGDRAARRR